MRLLSGAAITDGPDKAISPDWAQVTAGPWLAETLRALQTPDGAGADPGCSATIRMVAALPRLKCSRRLTRCLT